MHNRILLCTFFFLPLISFSQENSLGKLDNNVLTLSNGAVFHKGDTLLMGYGSGPFKNFEFVYVSPFSFGGGGQKLPSSWSNHTMTIKDFKFEGSKKNGKIFYVILKGPISPYWCEINSAIDNGEITVKGINDKKAIAVNNQPPTSKADELKKLFDLKQSGAITQQEYDSLKAKLLNQ